MWSDIPHPVGQRPNGVKIVSVSFSQILRRGYRGKTVVLTGAFVPLTDTIRSDGGFNIGFALAQLQHVDPGVYICMNGRILKASEATKIVTEGRFTSRDEGVG